MKTLLVVVALCLVAAVAGGFVANDRPVPARAKDTIAPVNATWIDALPADAAKATLFLLWGYLALPLTNAISRTHETEADLFGLNASQAPNGLAEFMIHDADTARIDPSALETALFSTHPGDRQRIEMPCAGARSTCPSARPERVTSRRAAASA